MIACAEITSSKPFEFIEFAFLSNQFNSRLKIPVTTDMLSIETISSNSNFAGNYKKNYSYNKKHQIPFLQYVKKIYFYQEGYWDDVGFVEINGIYKQGVSSNVKVGRKSGWFEYTSDQVQQIISKSTDNQVNIALGCHDIRGSRSDAVGPTVIYFSYKD